MTPRTRSFTDFDRPYRRGVVLGLSLAELFLILLFLLLLATIGYSAIVEEEVDQLRAANSMLEKTKQALNKARATNDQLAGEKADAMAKVGGAEAERDALRNKLTTLESQVGGAEAERDALRDKLKAADEALGNVIKAEDIQDLIVGLQERIDELEAQVDQLTPAAELGDEVREAAREAGVNSSDVPKIVADAAQAQSAIEGLKSQLADLEKERDALRDKLAALAEVKGQYAPCWYAKDTQPNGEPRERPLYIFDVRIDDDSVFVKDIPAPTPEYASQKPTLPFNRGALNKSLSFGKFLKGFQLLKDAADNKEVQVYPCKFYVKVWVATTSQESYRRALENVVENVFFTYPVKDEPWPY